MNETKEITVYEEDVFTKYVNSNGRKAVNAQKRAEAERKAVNAITKRAALFAIAAGAGLAFGTLGWMQEWFANSITAFCGLCSMFNVGYYFGVIRGIKR